MFTRSYSPETLHYSLFRACVSAIHSLLLRYSYHSDKHAAGSSVAVHLFPATGHHDGLKKHTRSIAGNTRLLASRRSSCNSMLPVPLNSSKITSSILLIRYQSSAVAIMVSEPPFSILRAAPKNCFGFCMAFASTPPDNTLPDAGATVLCARAKTGNRIKQDHHIMSTFYQSFCFLQGDGRNFYVFFCRFIKCRSNYFCFYTSFHICNLFRSFINQHNHQVTFRMIFCNGIGNFFQQHGFTVFGCATINPRCPLPIGVNRSMIRVLIIIRRCKKIQFFKRK